jgi:hypothetical protein
MAVRSFVTNYLVKEHDNYVEFMKRRTAEIKENGDKNTYKLFYKPGLMGKATGKNSVEYSKICKWHCIVLAYDIWYDVVKDYAIDGGSTSYKKFVDVPKSALKTFRYRVNNAIKGAECDYNKRINHNGQKPYDACRYLAMFWTYLDCIKDTKTQRFLPSLTTIHRACEVFSYSNDENPFIMNGKYWHYKNEEDSAVDISTDVTNNAYNVLDTNIRDMMLSSRTYNCLYRSKNETLGDILKMTPKELIHIRNFGRRSLNEIFNKVKEYGWQYNENDWTKLPTPIESVTDIAEEAARSLQNKASEAAENFRAALDKHAEAVRLESIIKKGPSPDDIPNENAEMVHPYDYNSLLDKYNKLQEKYDDIFKHLEEMTDKYDVLLKEKLDLESYNSRLKDDVSRLKDDLEGATAHISSMSRNREDMFVLIKSVLCKMEENKMNDLTMFIDGVSVDIHKQTGVYKGRPVPGTYAIRTREA